MPQVNVTISGRVYRMACGEGEEERIEHLAELFDARIGDLRKAFGEIGDMRLHVMAALTIADELTEAKQRTATLEAEVASLKQALGAGDARVSAIEGEVAQAVVSAAERIEDIAKRLNPPPHGG